MFQALKNFRLTLCLTLSDARSYQRALKAGADPLHDQADHLVWDLIDHQGASPYTTTALSWANAKGPTSNTRLLLGRALLHGLLKACRAKELAPLLHNKEAAARGPTLAEQLSPSEWAFGLQLAIDKDTTLSGERAGDMATLMAEFHVPLTTDVASALKYALHHSVQNGQTANALRLTEAIAQLMKHQQGPSCGAPTATLSARFFDKYPSGTSLFIDAAAQPHIFNYLARTFGLAHLSAKEASAAARVFAKTPPLFLPYRVGEVRHAFKQLQEAHPHCVTFSCFKEALQCNNLSFITHANTTPLNDGAKTELLYALARRPLLGRHTAEAERAAAAHLAPVHLSRYSLKRLLKICRKHKAQDQMAPAGLYQVLKKQAAPKAPALVL